MAQYAMYYTEVCRDSLEYEYKILSDQNADALSEKVTSYLADDWDLSGKLQFHDGIIYQVMIRKLIRRFASRDDDTQGDEGNE